MRENKRDRLARLNKVEHLLYQCPAGLPINSIADKCGVHPRTTRRDLEALEETGIPIFEQGTLRGIAEGYFLPPISFTLPEAMTIFMAARLLLAYSNTYNPNIDSTFVKLNSVVPAPLRDQVATTIVWMQKLNKNDRLRRIMDTLAHAWINGRKVRIWYHTLGRAEAKDRIIEPYFIQPAALERANYVIAYCNHAKKLLTFKIERITDIELLEERYSISAHFDANQHFGTAWGISVYGDMVDAELKFKGELATVAAETCWHPSQVNEAQQDGSVIAKFKIQVSHPFIGFILSWGPSVEV
jgi:predicted DNA-binding transcriptional regulator YafY